MAQHAGGIAGHDGIGGDVFGDHAAGADNGVLADGDLRQNRRAGADGGALFHQRALDRPVLFGLQLTATGGCARIAVVDEYHPVPDEHVVFNGDAFADKGMARNLAAAAHFGILLNLDKGADLSLVAHFAAVQVDELRQADATPQLDVGGNAQKVIVQLDQSQKPFQR